VSELVESNVFEIATGDRLLPHLRWELQQVMSRVRPDDLSTSEITRLLAILAPAHSRLIDRRADGDASANG
jgi:hypothetical protein